MARLGSTDGPLLVYGPRSATYDFGPGHPLTPRRFEPGIDLLRAVGAEPGLAPEPATDAELLAVHDAGYVAAVRRFGADPGLPPAFGIAHGGDVPPFPGMHEAAASVAGGSLRAMEAILRGDVDHAFHPGGGLHHAMPARASGFCVYNDVALAVAAARAAGLRVLYVDLDVHHGDGVEAIHADDPGVLTVSFHESGRYLFPGTGAADETGQGDAAGTVVNVPLEPSTGEAAWLAAVASLVPELAAAFRPDIVVSQHGADSHAWDPLAHLRVTTTAMGAAARLVDAVAHRHAGGRWLATGGGGLRDLAVVPRAWALTWLAGAHREAPDAHPHGMARAVVGRAGSWDGGAAPERFEDEPNPGPQSGPPGRSPRAPRGPNRRPGPRPRLPVPPRHPPHGGGRATCAPRPGDEPRPARPRAAQTLGPPKRPGPGPGRRPPPPPRRGRGAAPVDVGSADRGVAAPASELGVAAGPGGPKGPPRLVGSAPARRKRHPFRSPLALSTTSLTDRMARGIIVRPLVGRDRAAGRPSSTVIGLL